MVWVVFAVALAAGIVQVVSIGRSARGGVSPLSFVARIGLIVAVLVTAAKTGFLLPAVVGWIVGFTVASAVVYRRLP